MPQTGHSVLITYNTASYEPSCKSQSALRTLFAHNIIRIYTRYDTLSVVGQLCNIAGIIIMILDTPTSCPACDGGSAGECAGLVQSRAQFQSAAGQLQEDEDSRRTS